MCGTKRAQIVKENPNNSSVENNQQPAVIINLDHGDPTMYEPYWKNVSDESTITIPGYQSLSYFGNMKNVCWYLEPKLEEEIKNLHNLVGNAIIENHYIVVGNGSSHLIQAALYALSHPLNEPNPVSVVSAAPYYSAYEESANILRSGLFRWEGDAHCFNKDGPYIEMVTSPNNPDGFIREAIVSRPKGMLIHDHAYYWPQYTAITSPADHDIMLFTFSKCTGHAGTRIGWALVRDKEVAEKMVKFIMVGTIGVSKDAQLRAATILKTVSASCCKANPRKMNNFFEYSRQLLVERWKKLRDAVNKNDLFSVAKYPLQYCNFSQDLTQAHPGFAWLKCKEGIDCEKLLKEHKILTRSGMRFGSGIEYVRISLVSRDDDFDLFLQRLLTIIDSN